MPRGKQKLPSNAPNSTKPDQDVEPHLEPKPILHTQNPLLPRPIVKGYQWMLDHYEHFKSWDLVVQDVINIGKPVPREFEGDVRVQVLNYDMERQAFLEQVIYVDIPLPIARQRLPRSLLAFHEELYVWLLAQQQYPRL
ncbi:hypothetical protein PM082_023253 [Marasmius tenuissimus]|nr:hypothetical protein PM082_023253 [Marasmius tenuissimus]